MQCFLYQRLACLLLMMVIALPTAMAQDDDGPLGLFTTPYPETGSWFALDDSNTGFFLDVQNGRAAGAYFGFNGEGENVWLIFSGALEPLGDATTTGQLGWLLETPLTQSANGGCILDCTAVNTDTLVRNEVGTIFIQFNARSSAVFAVSNDENPPEFEDLQEIIPLYFGTSAVFGRRPFSPDTLLLGQPGLVAQPDMEGTWLVAIGNASLGAPVGDQIVQDGSVSEASFDNATGIIEIGPLTESVQSPPDVNNVSRIADAPILRDTTGFFPDGGTEGLRIQCLYFVNPDDVECTLEGEGLNEPPAGGSDSIMTRIPIGEMSDSRFVIYVREFGDTGDDASPTAMRFEAFRLTYD